MSAKTRPSARRIIQLNDAKEVPSLSRLEGYVAAVRRLRSLGLVIKPKGWASVIAPIDLIPSFTWQLDVTRMGGAIPKSGFYSYP